MRLFRRRPPKTREPMVDTDELYGAADSLTGWTYTGRTDWQDAPALLRLAAAEVDSLRRRLEWAESETEGR